MPKLCQYILLSLCLMLLTACAPVVRHRLQQTIHSLPPAPPEAMLLYTAEGSLSGSDCVAYYIEWLYGSQEPFDIAVRYYRDMLIEQGWESSSAGQTDASELVGFRRGRAEHFGIYSHDYFWTLNEIEIATRGGELSQQELDTYPTIFLVQVTRTCGYSEVEQ